MALTASSLTVFGTSECGIHACKHNNYESSSFQVGGYYNGTVDSSITG